VLMPFEWDVRVSSKDHTVTASTSKTIRPPSGYTTLRDSTRARAAGLTKGDENSLSGFTLEQSLALEADHRQHVRRSARGLLDSSAQPVPCPRMLGLVAR
jgi:hypothetical protein